MRFTDREYGDMEDKLQDASLYGEFISTYNYWVSSEDLHRRGEYLQNLGRINE